MQELDDPNSLFSRGITTRGVSDVLLTSMLYAAVDSESLRAPRHPGANTCAVRRARDYIYAHLNDEILVDQVTRAAGVSLRTLQYEFAKSYGIGPAALIRREKLKRIRAELSAETAGETISEIAGRWGFFDPKYLCRIYLREFGERPSETRRRALSGCKP
ncbi:MAG: AraC family transcriptional regulator [Proteobacteria bacterium]|nr:AraC family transcriptional regulator [Pseudomonadota bacterium]